MMNSLVRLFTIIVAISRFFYLTAESAEKKSIIMLFASAVSAVNILSTAHIHFQ